MLNTMCWYKMVNETDMFSAIELHLTASNKQKWLDTYCIQTSQLKLLCILLRTPRNAHTAVVVLLCKLLPPNFSNHFWQQQYHLYMPTQQFTVHIAPKRRLPLFHKAQLRIQKQRFAGREMSFNWVINSSLLSYPEVGSSLAVSP